MRIGLSMSNHSSIPTERYAPLQLADSHQLAGAFLAESKIDVLLLCRGKIGSFSRRAAISRQIVAKVMAASSAGLEGALLLPFWSRTTAHASRKQSAAVHLNPLRITRPVVSFAKAADIVAPLDT